jgi:hypothetical protein
MAITDRYDLPLTTSSVVAAERFQSGMDALLAYGPGAEQSFAAATAASAVRISRARPTALRAAPIPASPARSSPSGCA